MNFQMTTEQQMLVDSVQRFLARDYSFDARRQRLSDPASPRWQWERLAELGLLGLIVPEDDGGIGGNAFDAMLVARALAPGLMLGPWHEVAIESVSLLSALKHSFDSHDPISASKREQLAETLHAIACGKRMIVPAHDEALMQGDMLAVRARADPAGEGFVIHGSKHLVCAGAVADQWLVSATIGDCEEQRIGVFLFGAEIPGVQIRRYPGMDSRWYADLGFRDCWVPSRCLLSADAAKAIGLAQAMRMMSWCADAQGCMHALVEQTKHYLQTRQQFGQVIGRFQALQHRAVDMFIHTEQAYSMLIRAADACERRIGRFRAEQASTDAIQRPLREDALSWTRELTASRLLIGIGARSVSQEAVQLHGGMGVTDELCIGHFFRRLTAFELRLGDTDYHNQLMSKML